MASITRPCFLLLLSILFFSSILLSISSAALSSSSSIRRRLLQSNSATRNIETFFPSSSSPAFESNPSPPPPPPSPTQLSSRTVSPTKKSEDVTVTKAVVATAASTFVVSGLLFFGVQRIGVKRRRIENNRLESSDDKFRGGEVSANPYRATRVSGNLKVVAVDEDGLDMLYWRKLEDGNQRRCSHCLKALDGDDDRRERVAVQKARSRQEAGRVQEIPLLPADSLNSSNRTLSESMDSNSGDGSSRIPSAAKAEAVPSTTRLMPPPPPLPLPPSMQAPKTASPPPPPTPSTPASPPPAVKKNLPSPPPPPRPPLSTNKNPAPPPPPPPAAGGSASSSSRPPPVPLSALGERSNSRPATVERSSMDNGRAQTKLKPLHWDKVTTANAEHSMVWDKISDGSFRFDDDLMEALFGYVATNRKSPDSKKTPTSYPFNASRSAAVPPTQICLLEPRKSQNIAIVLRSLAISRQEILDALYEGRGLSSDTLEKLSKMAPTKEEEARIVEFSGNPSNLADAESFLFHLSRAVPSPFTRLDAMLFKSNYEPEILHLKASLRTLESACRELKSRGLFLKLLEAVLKAGNRMNAGTTRGDARAFNLASLRKLSDVKSTDGKTTLLHFVVEEVVRSEGKRCAINRNHSIGRRTGSTGTNPTAADSPARGRTTREEKEREYMMLGLPVVGGLSVEFADVKKAAVIDHDGLASSCSTLRTRVGEIRQFLGTCGGGSGGGFVEEMKGFLERAEEELKVVKEEQDRVMELVRRTTEYYQVGASKDRAMPPLQLFVVVKDFLAMVDKVCIDVARNLQQKKSLARIGSPPTPEKRSPVRFPNLPAHFITDNSKSFSEFFGKSGP